MQKFLKIKKEQILLVIVILINIYMIKSFPNSMFYDSKHYMDLSSSFIKDNSFKLTNYNEPLRGYLFPLILYLINILGSLLKFQNIIFFYRINAIIIFTLFNYYILYEFISKIFQTNSEKKLERIIFILIINYSWIGLYMYSLSDFWSILFVVTGLYCLQKSYSKERSSQLLVITSGIFIAGAYYIRPIYLISLVIIGIYLLIKRDIKRLLMIGLGIFIIGFPQLWINIKNFDLYSFFIPTQIIYNGRSLYLQQLFWGVFVQRYETNINHLIFSNAQVIYEDLLGKEILKNTNLQEFKSYYEYITFLLKNITTIIFMYAKHFFNIFDHYFPTIYIENIFKNRILFSSLNYTIWYLFFINIKSKLLIIKKENYIYIISFLIPVFISIPTALEIRFVLPLYLIGYFISIESLFKYKKYCKISNLIQYCTFIIVSFSLSILIFSNIVGVELKNNI